MRGEKGGNNKFNELNRKLDELLFENKNIIFNTSY